MNISKVRAGPVHVRPWNEAESQRKPSCTASRPSLPIPRVKKIYLTLTELMFISELRNDSHPLIPLIHLQSLCMKIG